MELLFLLPVLLFSVVVHEVAHGLVAKWEGDPTAEQEGRLTLNPIPHLDLWGSIIVPALLLMTPGGFIFGWAKPVPVNPSRFRNHVWGDIRVSLAGVASNFILAFLCTLILGALILVQQGGAGGTGPGGVGPGAGGFGAQGGVGGGILTSAVAMARFGILINVILAVFNLVPLPPLDGSHVVYHVLPRRWAEPYRKAGRFGIAIIFVAIFLVPQVFQVIFWPVEVIMGLAYDFIDLWT